MSDTNFYDSLSAFAASQPLRMCMPGHKGRTMPMEEWDALAPLDFTELPPTGNLYGGDDWLEDSQRLWAWDWGMNAAFYATGDLPRSIREACRTPIHYRETLITDGLHRIWLRNRKG